MQYRYFSIAYYSIDRSYTNLNDIHSFILRYVLYMYPIGYSFRMLIHFDVISLMDYRIIYHLYILHKYNKMLHS